MVYQVKDQGDFNKQLSEAGSKLVVIDFYATWCGPCKMIAPKLEEMSQSMSDVVFLKVDVDECEDIAADNQITCMPTFLFMKNGQKVETLTGANEAKLREIIQKNK
ncbi:thioredoxin-2-like [Penaeus japonicus]|uniref:Thioredoxin n=1 Tax=Penaeus japonicus TaxID=27405 RepID=A0A4D5XL86_PENJP|nr:thioredoxin-2-like [Penaeus japonicus]QBP79223.1 thioredoxin [Penaeus japonicus]